MNWIVLAAEAAEAATRPDTVTSAQLLSALGGLCLVVGTLFWLREKQSAEHQKQCTEDRTRLIQRLDDKDAKIEKLHQDAKEVITNVVIKANEIGERQVAAIEKLGQNQEEFTKTLHKVRCAYQSGQNQAIGHD